MVNSILVSAVVLADSAVPSEYAEDGTPIGSPGFLGFVVMMILGTCIIFLMLDLSRRTRRMRYRNEYAMAREAQLRAEEKQQETSDDTAEEGRGSPAAGAGRAED